MNRSIFTSSVGGAIILVTQLSCIRRTARPSEEWEERACVIVASDTVECRTAHGSSATYAIPNGVVSVASTRGGICVLDSIGSVVLISPSGQSRQTVLEDPTFSSVFGVADSGLGCCAKGRYNVCSGWNVPRDDWSRLSPTCESCIGVKSFPAYLVVDPEIPHEIEPDIAATVAEEWMSDLNVLNNVLLKNAIWTACKNLSTHGYCRVAPKAVRTIEADVAKIVFGSSMACVSELSGTLTCFGTSISTGACRRNGVTDFDIDGDLICATNQDRSVDCHDTTVLGVMDSWCEPIELP